MNGVQCTQRSNPFQERLGLLPALWPLLPDCPKAYLFFFKGILGRKSGKNEQDPTAGADWQRAYGAKEYRCVPSRERRQSLKEPHAAGPAATGQAGPARCKEAMPSANRSPSGPTAIPLGKRQATGVSSDGFHFCFLKKSGVLKTT